jgi:HEAT repeat protein
MRKSAMSFNYELDKLNLEELIARFNMPSPEGEEYEFAYYLDVSGLIAKQGAKGLAFLQEQLDKANTVRLRALLFALTQSDIETPLSLEQLLSYLRDERPEIVAETIDSLRRQDRREVKHIVFNLLQHPSPYVRGSVLRYISSLYPNEALPFLIDALKDENFIVRENVADEMGELGMLEVLPYLRSLLTDSHPDVQQAAQSAIEILKANLPDENNIVP